MEGYARTWFTPQKGEPYLGKLEINLRGVTAASERADFGPTPPRITREIKI